MPERGSLEEREGGDIGAPNEHADVGGDPFDDRALTTDAHGQRHDPVGVDATAEIGERHGPFDASGAQDHGSITERGEGLSQSGCCGGWREPGQVDGSRVNTWQDSADVGGFVGRERAGRHGQHGEQPEHECDQEARDGPTSPAMHGRSRLIGFRDEIRCGFLGHLDRHLRQRVGRRGAVDVLVVHTSVHPREVLVVRRAF